MRVMTCLNLRKRFDNNKCGDGEHQDNRNFVEPAVPAMAVSVLVCIELFEQVAAVKMINEGR